MKRLIAALSLLLLLCYSPLVAQSVSRQNVRVTVPFEFILNDTTYPAGEYLVMLDTAGSRIMIGNTDQWLAFANSHDIGTNNEFGDTRLVFTDVDGKHYLHQVWIGGQDHGHDLLHESAEHDITH